MQSNKSIKILVNYFVGPVLFLWLSFSIYKQIVNQPRLGDSWAAIRDSITSGKIALFALVVLLIPVNWGLEAWKWRLLARPVKNIGFWQAYRAVLSGVSFSVSMPNRIGEYMGRMMYMPEGSRLKTISAAVVGSVAQLIITLGAGLISLLFLKNDLLRHYPQLVIWYQFAFYFLLGFFVLVVAGYFQVDRMAALLRRWRPFKRYQYLVESLSNFNGRFLLFQVFLSFLRYSIFLLQYLLLYSLFGVSVSPFVAAGVTSVLFLAMAVIPSVALVEVGLRGEISLKLMQMFTANSLAVGFTTVSAWFLNLIVPAVIGSLLLLKFKLRQKNEKK